MATCGGTACEREGVARRRSQRRCVCETSGAGALLGGTAVGACGVRGKVASGCVLCANRCAVDETVEWRDAP